MDAFNVITGLAGMIGAGFALLAWCVSNRVHKEMEAEKIRLNKSIRVTLNNGSKTLELPVHFRRAEFNRGEILGRIGMIPVKEKGKRFSLEFINNTDFFEQINTINDGHDEGLLTISCSDEEFDQFDLKD